jgi:hypothetical protein
VAVSEEVTRPTAVIGSRKPVPPGRIDSFAGRSSVCAACTIFTGCVEDRTAPCELRGSASWFGIALAWQCGYVRFTPALSSAHLRSLRLVTLTRSLLKRNDWSGLGLGRRRSCGFREAERAFTARDDERNALYAAINVLRGQLPRLPVPEISDRLAEYLEHPLVKADDRLRLRTLVIKGETDTDLDPMHAFLRDPHQRAAVWPSPNPTRCYVNTPLGQMRFDVNTDEGPARDVVREALRRFRADLKPTEDRRARAKAEYERRHDERKAAVAHWVSDHGTADQRARHAAGLLPLREVVSAMTDQAFHALADRAVYASDGLEHLQRHARQWTGQSDVVIPPAEFLDFGGLAHAATPTQWARLQEFQAAMPDANVRLHRREYIWKRHSVPVLRHITILVTKTEGPFTLRREYLMPGEEQPSIP